jgi:hypothetical protein
VKIIYCIIVLLFCCSTNIAHSCATYKDHSDKDHSNELHKVDSIFDGEIVSAIDPGVTENKLITFKVLEVWKGEQKSQITVRYADLCSMGAPIPAEEIVGKKWLVYAYAEKNEPLLYVNCCMHTLFDNERMKREYGEGIAITHPTPEEPIAKSNKSLWVWIVSAIILSLLAFRIIKRKSFVK